MSDDTRVICGQPIRWSLACRHCSVNRCGRYIAQPDISRRIVSLIHLTGFDPVTIDELKTKASRETVTLVYAAKDEEIKGP